MTYVLIAVVVIVLIVGAVFTTSRNSAIQKNGVEADAVVSRIKSDDTQDADGHTTITYTYFVQYQTREGETIEARLGNEPKNLFVGSKLRIKYLPEKPKYVIPAK